MFKERLEANARLVEDRLQDLLNGEGEGDFAPPQRLAEAMRYGSLGGGKRLRPHLLIESAAIFGAEREAALDAAAALECVHCYSLIHDDLPAMDDDDLRRGRPTVHKAFDDATAILAGDSLLTLAFEIMARESTHSDPAARSRLTLGLAQAAGWRGMAGGQMLDLMAPGQTLDADEIALLQAMKTGALLKFACEAGGIIGGASADDMAALSRYGATIGQAFQLADDLLDAEGDAATLGKAAGKDEAAGKATLITLLGLDAAKARLRELEQKAVRALEPFGPRGEMLATTADFIIRRTH
ncbi:polyprenyl synthetase family protein [Dichotomicrobium thermohalophilum]|uniref:Probable farnesyl diphosphate synthase n=1 Tax=Dichotomicrobium thermohalophilum TaxID=933063 RepID=A0A397QAV7_9HYPH|nr:farnesyl diphosphate synthase [Dichotomicrobium thermohalophilum]RIA55351.1 farnesyl-diphosphate synthase [Dichotomicrobium thermohalophilum]